ncbi:hypothetical protein [Caldifermentibacillus hisashii]|uniref:hypothetical protein n=1 Tax=Caldifermentibacillus hisashii TaxID=996558 RepID=UPI0030EAFFAC
MVTRIGLVVKNKHFSPKNGNENRARRQKIEFSAQKWRRETRLVVKKERFSPKNDDEIVFRRQNRAVFTSNW